ncbi:MAG: hypothetical protein ABI142_12215 [Bryocella sp.]
MKIALVSTSGANLVDDLEPTKPVLAHGIEAFINLGWNEKLLHGSLPGELV